jgi:RimJ/RimL family protein N-acetyltransferase
MIDHGYGVQLGPIEAHNLDLLRSWRNMYSIWKSCRQNDLIDSLSQKRWFERISADPSIKMYEIRVEGRDVPMGVCGLTSIDLNNRRAEFSLYIAPMHQRDGMGTRTLKTLLAHGFKTLGLNSIWGETFEGNHAITMFEKIGFKTEGTRRQFYFRDGKFLDATLVSMLASEFK